MSYLRKGMKTLILCLLLILPTTTQISALSYDEAKDALTSLEKLKADKLITDAEYSKRRETILDSIGDNSKAGEVTRSLSANSMSPVRLDRAKPYLEKAFDEVNLIKDENVSDQATRRLPELIAIATAQFLINDAEAGQQTFARATDMVDKNTSNYLFFSTHPDSLGKIAEAQAKVGDIDAAKTTVDKDNWKVSKVHDLCSIAVIQAREGSARGARESLKEAKDIAATDDNPSSQMITVNEYETQLIDVADKKTPIELIEEGDTEKRALYDRISSLAKAGNMTDAEATVRTLTIGKDRCFGYIAIVRGLLR